MTEFDCEDSSFSNPVPNSYVRVSAHVKVL